MTSDLQGARRGFRWGQAIAVAIAFSVLTGLGIWQVQRLGWKTQLLAHIAAVQTAPAQDLDGALRQVKFGADLDYTRVRAACPDLEQRPALHMYALRDGAIGYRLIAACPLASGPYGSILVDRGFVAHDDVDKVRPSASPLDQPVIGVLRKGDPKNWLTPASHADENLWYGRDVAAMAAKLGAPDPAPLFLMLESPAPKAFGPTPAPLPTDIPNNHLGYIITWFGLALALLSVYIAKLRRDRRA